MGAGRLPSEGAPEASFHRTERKVLETTGSGFEISGGSTWAKELDSFCVLLECHSWDLHAQIRIGFKIRKAFSVP